MKKNIVFFIIVLSFILGCVPKARYIVKDFSYPRRVAVLPMINNTNDLDGPCMVRSLFHAGLKRKRYYTIPIKEIDRLLKNEGITDGGQLKAISYQELKEVLGVDAAFFGTLLEFGDIMLGFYQNRVVKANFKLIELGTGKILWEDEKKISNKKLAFNSKNAWKAFKKQVVEKTVEKTLRFHLRKESQRMINLILSTLPNNL